MRIGRKTNTIFLVLVLSVLVAACSSGGDLPGKNVPTHPGDDSLVSGDGRVTPFHGRVVFADTGMGIASFVTFKSETIYTEVGDFHVNIPQGKNEYILKTLLGNHLDHVLHDGDGRKYLRYPAFEEWSPEYFDELLIWESTGQTRRWPTDAEVPVWIESSNDDSNVTTEGLQVAREALAEWEDILGGTIRFKETRDKSKATENGITIEFISESQMDDEIGAAAGYCQIRYRPERSEIVAGKIKIVYRYQDSIALHLHEIGHCIGLRHTSNRDDIMYPYIVDRDRRVTERERNMTRLLYMLPPGRFPLTSQNAMLHQIEVDRNGIAEEIIPTFH